MHEQLTQEWNSFDSKMTQAKASAEALDLRLESVTATEEQLESEIRDLQIKIREQVSPSWGKGRANFDLFFFFTWHNMKTGVNALWSGTNKNRDVSTGHSLVHLLVRSHRSLDLLLWTACFARALHCAHSFARSLTSLTPSLARFAHSLTRGIVNF